jgi:hypothetical protein
MWTTAARSAAQRSCEPCHVGAPFALADDLPARQSITSSARASSVGGTSRPSTLAVVKLMTRSNLVGCSTGMSGGGSAF